MHLSLSSVAIFVLTTLANAQNDEDCVVRNSVDLNFADIDGVYYLMLYVNETHPIARTSCIKITFKFEKTRNELHETVEMINVGSTQVSTTNLISQVRSPGILEQTDIRNGTTVTFLDHIMEFTKGESLISSVCQKNDGKLYGDKVAVFFTTRDVSPDAILAKLRSVGITGSEPNTDYFFVPQFQCPN